MPKKKKNNKTLNIKTVLFFLFLTIILCAPSIYRCLAIMEIYLDKDVRDQTLNAVFFLREEYGLTMGDMTIKNVVIQEPDYIITIHEKYHGYLDMTRYDDLERDYFVKYVSDEKKFEVLEIVESS